MRNKYKKINQLYRSVFPIRSRILNFKKSKWKELKLYVLKKRVFSFLNSDSTNIKKFYWKKFSKTYKNASLAKDSFMIENNNHFSMKRLKNILLMKKFSVTKNFFINIFRIDIFLWGLNIFSSSHEVYQCIVAGGVCLNNRLLDSLVFLKKGDIVRINFRHFFFRNLLIYNKFFLSFCELDFYTGKIVIIKTLKELSFLDFCLISQNTKDLYNLRYYLRKN